MKKTLLVGNFGAGNIGDEAILLGFLDRFPGNDYIIISAHPNQTKKNYKTPSIHPIPCGPRSFFRSFFSGNLSKTIKEFRESKKVIFPGGGLFCDPSKAIFIWFIHLSLALILKKEVYFYGQSFIPISNKVWRKILGKALRNKRIKKIEVRDPLSKDFLEKKLKLKEIKLGKDSATYLKNIPLKPKSINKNKKVVVSLREGSTTKKEIIKLAEELEKKYTQIIFLEMQRANKDEKGDKIEHQKIAKYISNKSIYKFHTPKDPHDAMKVIFECDLVIASRLHAIVLAHVLGKRFRALTKSDKIRGFLKV